MLSYWYNIFADIKDFGLLWKALSVKEKKSWQEKAKAAKNNDIKSFSEKKKIKLVNSEIKVLENSVSIRLNHFITKMWKL